MCSEAIKTDIDLLLEDLGSAENLNHECIILYDNHVCKVFNKDYTVNEDNVLLFDSLLDWRETALNTYQLKSLLSSLRWVQILKCYLQRMMVLHMVMLQVI